MLAMLNHPWLVEAQCEAIAALEFTHRPFGPLKTALLEIITQSAAQHENSPTPTLDAQTVHAHLLDIGLASVIDQAIRAVTHLSDRFAAAGAEPAVVVAGFNQALALHRSRVIIARDLELAERAWHADQTEENRARMEELIGQLGQRLEMDSA